MGTFMDLAPITGFLQGWANASYREREMALQETRARVAAKNASDEMALRQAQQRWTESIWPAQKDYMTAQTQSLQAGTQAKTAATAQAASYEAAKQEIAQAVKQKILSGELGKLTPGTIYPALKTLRKNKLIYYEQDGRKKIYKLTGKGAAEYRLVKKMFKKI